MAGLTTFASLMSPPGGLDSSGYIRFKRRPAYFVYFMFAEMTFLYSFSITWCLIWNLMNVNNEHKVKSPTPTLSWSFTLLWITAVLFHSVLMSGFWLVYPPHEPLPPLPTFTLPTIHHISSLHCQARFMLILPIWGHIVLQSTTIQEPILRNSRVRCCIMSRKPKLHHWSVNGQIVMLGVCLKFE